jgi:outer membrane protein OmpA-like peptidoglycan-associated protein
MKPIMSIIIIACAGFLFGCATVPPAELINAREAYKEASAGQAAQLVPAELHKAQEALAVAEKSFKDDPQSFHTRDLAYVADRKAKMAEALAITAAGDATTVKANKDYETTQTEIVKNTKEELAASQRNDTLKSQQLAAQQKASSDAQARSAKDSTDAYSQSTKGLADAEARLVRQQANADTAALRAKESSDAEANRIKGLTDAEARRLAEQNNRDNNTIIILEKGKHVILNGVTFDFNKATLRSESVPVLTRAYNAMIANPDVQVEISGHTDNVGSQEFNQALSLKRAEAVRNWLVDKGIASNRMKTVGRGENEPVASNDTDAGRAKNRRIEFYVQQ